MKLFHASAILLLVLETELTSTSISTTNQAVADAFNKAGIVPDLIPKAPGTLLIAKYRRAEVSLGNEIFPTKAVEPPTLQLQFDIDGYFTFAIIDPDVPSTENPYLRFYLMALYVNMVNLDLKSAYPVAPHIATIPITGSGKHRFILLLYKQETPLDVQDPNLLSLKGNLLTFSIADFTRNYSLRGPVAGNFFYSEISEDLHCEL